MTNQVAEFAYDLHAGLSSLRISEFDDLHTIGMAATLSIHIKSLGQIDYQVLRKVSDHFMAIPSVALERVLRVLADIGFVRLVENGRRIAKVIPNIPRSKTCIKRLEITPPRNAHSMHMSRLRFCFLKSFT